MLLITQSRRDNALARFLMENSMIVDIDYYHSNHGINHIGTLSDFIDLCNRWEPLVEHLRNNSLVAELVMDGSRYFAFYTSGTESSGLRVFSDKNGKSNEIEVSRTDDEFLGIANNDEWYVVSIPEELEVNK